MLINNCILVRKQTLNSAFNMDLFVIFAQAITHGMSEDILMWAGLVRVPARRGIVAGKVMIWTDVSCSLFESWLGYVRKLQ